LEKRDTDAHTNSEDAFIYSRHKSSFMIPFRPRELTASIENVFVQTKSSKDYSDFCGGPMNAADFTACLPQDLPWLISFSLGLKALKLMPRQSSTRKYPAKNVAIEGEAG
jgi:hypothetical protein